MCLYDHDDANDDSISCCQCVQNDLLLRRLQRRPTDVRLFMISTVTVAPSIFVIIASGSSEAFLFPIDIILVSRRTTDSHFLRNRVRQTFACSCIRDAFPIRTSKQDVLGSCRFRGSPRLMFSRAVKNRRKSCGSG